jgi:hypothetical protein
MPRWKPEAQIGQNERIGRRIFDAPMLSGARDQKRMARLEYTHFLETAEHSFDRLGRTGVDKKILTYLRPRAETHGQSFHQPAQFDCWATIKAQDLRQPPKGFGPWILKADPLTDPPPNDNEYHAHGERPQGLDDVSTALQLRHLFEAKGNVISPFGVTVDLAALPPKQGTWWRRVLARLNSLLAK